MEIGTKEDLINIIKNLTSDVTSLQEEIVALKTTETTEGETKETEADSNATDGEAEEVNEEEVDEIHKLLSEE